MSDMHPTLNTRLGDHSMTNLTKVVYVAPPTIYLDKGSPSAACIDAWLTLCGARPWLVSPLAPQTHTHTHMCTHTYTHSCDACPALLPSTPTIPRYVEMAVQNVHRAVGTTLSHEVTKRFGDKVRGPGGRGFTRAREAGNSCTSPCTAFSHCVIQTCTFVDHRASPHPLLIPASSCCPGSARGHHLHQALRPRRTEPG